MNKGLLTFTAGALVSNTAILSSLAIISNNADFPPHYLKDFLIVNLAYLVSFLILVRVDRSKPDFLGFSFLGLLLLKLIICGLYILLFIRNVLVPEWTRATLFLCLYFMMLISYTSSAIFMVRKN